MNLQKINNFAFTLAIALGIAGASALSSSSVVQAKALSDPTVSGQGYQQRYYVAPQQRQQQRYYYPQRQGQQQRVMPQQRPPQAIIAPPTNVGMNTPLMQGFTAGQQDGLGNHAFRPCDHMEYQNNFDKRFRSAFLEGYSQGYFSVNP